jgi:transcription factor WhiB
MTAVTTPRHVPATSPDSFDHDRQYGGPAMEREWELKAVCRTREPDIWFTRKGRAEARLMCNACPVRADCLEAVLEREAGLSAGYRAGIFAGLTGTQRAEVARQRDETSEQPVKQKPRGPGRKPSPCGTRAAYQRHQRKGEPIDQACRDAHARAGQQYRRTGSTQVPAGR